MVLESDSLRNVLPRLERQPLNNVYTLECELLNGRKVLLVDRACDTLQLKFRSRMRLVESMTSEEMAAVNSPAIRNEKRKYVMNLCKCDDSELRERVRTGAVCSVRDYELATFVSLGAFALHLKDLRRGGHQERLDRFDRNDPHVFGDAELLQDALFLGAGVFSDDRTDVGNLAALLGVPCRTSREMRT